jgi:3-hydroxyacyl-CoA dehydrogenase
MTISRLVEWQSQAFARDFLITHFFNPPRWMRLLEIVEGKNTRPGVAAAISDFAAHRLGKSVVVARDTPGFIANRIGNFWMAVALDEAISASLEIEEADAILSQIFGGPAGIFALLDLVGIDLLPIGWGSLMDALPTDDSLQGYAAEPPLITDMIAKGRIGRKGSGGFFRRLENGEFEALDLVTQEYRPRRPPATAATGENLRALVEKGSPAGLFAARVTALTLRYAIELAPQIADSNELVDQAMRDGYGWKRGPFELIERIGRDWMEAQEEALR